MPRTIDVDAYNEHNLSLAIPLQRVAVPDASSAGVQDRWWYTVILKNHRVDETWLADGRPAAEAPRLAHRWTPVDCAQHDQLVRAAFQTRTAKERAHNA